MLGGDTGRARCCALRAVLLSHAILNHVGVRWSPRSTPLRWYHLFGVACSWRAHALCASAPARVRFTAWTAEPHPYFYVSSSASCRRLDVHRLRRERARHRETVDPTRTRRGEFFVGRGSGVCGYACCSRHVAIGDLASTAAAPNPFIAILTTRLPGSAGRALGGGDRRESGSAAVVGDVELADAVRVRARRRPADVVAARRVSVAATARPRGGVDVGARGVRGRALGGRVLGDVALSTIALCASYALPIALGMRAAERQVARSAPGPRPFPTAWNASRSRGRRADRLFCCRRTTGRRTFAGASRSSAFTGSRTCVHVSRASVTALNGIGDERFLGARPSGDRAM